MTLSDNDAALVVAAARKILASDAPGGRWDSRSFFARGGALDDTIGMQLWTNADAHIIRVTLGALAGDKMCVEDVLRVAAGVFPAGAFVTRPENQWLRDLGTAYARALVPLISIGTLYRRDSKS